MSNDKKVNLAFEYRATKTYNKKFQAAAQPVPAASAGGVSAAELMRRAKKEEAEMKKKAEMKKRAEDLKKKSQSPVKEIEESEDEEEFVSANEESENEEVEVEMEDEEEKENAEEDNRRLINERLMSAINNMNQEDQTNFKVGLSDNDHTLILEHPPPRWYKNKILMKSDAFRSTLSNRVT